MMSGRQTDGQRYTHRQVHRQSKTHTDRQTEIQTVFSIYTIELANILRKHNVNFNLYADDTQFYFPIDTIEVATKKTDEIMIAVKRWMKTKKLKLNEEKTDQVYTLWIS